MIICLEVWQAVIAAIFFALVFTWAGYATAKVFMFSERDIKQRKHIHSLKLLVEHLQDEKYVFKSIEKTNDALKLLLKSIDDLNPKILEDKKNEFIEEYADDLAEFLEEQKNE